MTETTAAPRVWPDFPRSSGILLHPTSFPGPYGIGEIGRVARDFVDFLAEAQQNLWQVMPLGPTGYGDSPYQCFSAFAGNPLLICFDSLLETGWLTPDDLAGTPAFPQDHVDYGPVINWRGDMLRRAYQRFRDGATEATHLAVARYALANKAWLDDFALFMALKEKFSAAWPDWPQDIARRTPQALAHWRQALADDIARHVFYQYEFDRQWGELHAYAQAKGVSIVGDIPIFVAYDSADVWARPDLFHLDDDGRPTAVAGVPPDYFSPTGQLWGNPLYRWEIMDDGGYAWWIERFRNAFRLVDIVRLDHFRGFVAYWSVPADEETAINGTWEPGPGAKLFEAVREALGPLPIIAEDLGIITPDVEALREGQGFPGMKVLQFAFSNASNPYLPHNYTAGTVVYTGTHDNDTTAGWFAKATPADQAFVLDYSGGDARAVPWALIRLAMGSVARWAVFPMQDLFALGSEARMNKPGEASGNWAWRMPYIPVDAIPGLRRLSRTYGRGPLADRQYQTAREEAAAGVDVAMATKSSEDAATESEDEIF